MTQQNMKSTSLANQNVLFGIKTTMYITAITIVNNVLNT